MPGPATPIRVGVCEWSLCTPSIPAAVAILQLTGDVAVAFDRLTVTPVQVGRVAVRSLAGIDTGLVARWSDSRVHLMPHGGSAVVRALIAALEAADIRRAESVAPTDAYPEAADELEARMLAALAHAASPLAVDRLLSEPTRWRAHAQGTRARCDPPTSRALHHLLTPPLVVSVGPANIGKSTLINTLAGRHVAIVADESGTTRDHVGVLLEFAGLVVRYVDTPGLHPNPDEIEREAQGIALDLARQADLILIVGDAHSLPIDPGPLAIAPERTLRVALREDLAPASWNPDLRVSARTSAGLADLARAIRERLIPQSAIDDPGAWAFWESPAPRSRH